MTVKVHFNDSTTTEIPEEALSGMERLLHDKIEKVEYLHDQVFDAVNELAKRQLAEIEAREKAQLQAKLADEAKKNAELSVKNNGLENPAIKTASKRGRKPKQ